MLRRLFGSAQNGHVSGEIDNAGLLKRKHFFLANFEISEKVPILFVIVFIFFIHMRLRNQNKDLVRRRTRHNMGYFFLSCVVVASRIYYYWVCMCVCYVLLLQRFITKNVCVGITV